MPQFLRGTVKRGSSLFALTIALGAASAVCSASAEKADTAYQGPIDGITSAGDIVGKDGTVFHVATTTRICDSDGKSIDRQSLKAGDMIVVILKAAPPKPMRALAVQLGDKLIFTSELHGGKVVQTYLVCDGHYW